MRGGDALFVVWGSVLAFFFAAAAGVLGAGTIHTLTKSTVKRIAKTKTINCPYPT
jgi:hypothetical protein